MGSEMCIRDRGTKDSTTVVVVLQFSQPTKKERLEANVLFLLLFSVRKNVLNIDSFACLFCLS